jgi:NAD(P)-dependent dehydrogenase (short-subunit alcohol dehydrogenase family)
MAPRALITGAAGGVGQATVEAFVGHGWQVVGVDRDDSSSAPKGAQLWKTDLSKANAVEEIIQRLRHTGDTLDALVNNAAIQLVKPIPDTTLEEWDAVHQINLRAIFSLSRSALPLLLAARGAIVNVSSVHALATSANLAAYASSKGALLALTRAMALEFGPAGVRVNAVLPGAVDTRMLREGLARDQFGPGSVEQKVEAMGARTALGRIGRPAEIANAILFLADHDRSSYITGQALVVDGGALARLSTE